MSDLLPCPFCGGQPFKVVDCPEECDNEDCEECAYECENCVICVSVKTWNTRTSRWVSVDDETPDVGTSVIALCYDNCADLVKWDGDDWKTSRGHWVPKSYFQLWAPVPTISKKETLNG